MANVNKAIFPRLYGFLCLITIEAGLLKPKVMLDLETHVFAHVASRSPDSRRALRKFRLRLEMVLSLLYHLAPGG